MGETLRQYSLRCGREDLLSQWDTEQNGDLTPDTVSYGSKKLVWWRCDQGHTWQSPVYARAGKGSGCPYCAGKLVAPGRDLKSLYPDIAAQWHPDKNMDKIPDTFLPGSHQTVWWRCEHGHEWRATIKSRVEGNGCPVCAGKIVVPGQNDLASCAPLLARQWHPEKNGLLTPDQVTCGSDRKVWWRCNHGHEWQARIHTRVAGKGCPVCAGKVVTPGVNDLQSCYPELAKQWHLEKNDGLTPALMSVYSNRKVWWRCEHGHEWQSAVGARTTRKSECPYCTGRKVLSGFNDLKTVQPLVAAQWHPTRNESLEPTMVTVGCSRKVWWQCTDGHEWKAVIYSRTGAKKCGCPVCAGREAKRA